MEVSEAFIFRLPKDLLHREVAECELVEWDSGEWSLRSGSKTFDVSFIREAPGSGQYLSSGVHMPKCIDVKASGKFLVKVHEPTTDTSKDSSISSRILLAPAVYGPGTSASKSSGDRSGKAPIVSAEFLEESDIE